MKDGECLFTAPLYFGRYKKEEEFGDEVSKCNNCFGLAELGSEVECDLGMVRLPKFDKYEKDAECKGKEKKTKCKWKPFDKAYLTKENMELVLKGEISDGIKIVESKELWSNEYRLGIELEKGKKTTKEGALYSTNHIRLEKGVGLGVVVDGIDERLKTEGIIPFGAESRLTNLEFKEVGVDSLISRNAKKVKKENGKLEKGMESKLWIDSIIPFGGESKLANVEMLDKGISLPTGPKADELNKENGKVKFTVVHITPAYFDKLPHFGEKLPEIEGRVVFAFLGRPTKIGGWDSVRNEPLPLKSCIPAGSAWFCEADAKYAENIVRMNGGQIGEMKEFGLGQILIGRW
jgi:CRISPR-associated protein Cmr3